MKVKPPYLIDRSNTKVTLSNGGRYVLDLGPGFGGITERMAIIKWSEQCWIQGYRAAQRAARAKSKRRSRK